MLHHKQNANDFVKINFNRIFMKIVTIFQYNTIIVIPLYNLQTKQIEVVAKT